MGKSEEDFDPYYKWLGIKPKDQPPHHYRLLGIESFESDVDVIANAADMQMAHLRKFQSGKHSKESQQLLNEVAKAKICLLNPEKKADYDAGLRERLRPPKVEPLPGAEPTFVEPEPIVDFPFVNTGQAKPVDEAPFFGPSPDVGSPGADAPAIGPPPGFVEPVPINPFAEFETEEPPSVAPPVDAAGPFDDAPTIRPPTARPPRHRPARPPAEPAPPGEKPSLDEALSKVMGSPAGAPSPTAPVPEVTTPATSLAPDELAKKIAADQRASRPPVVERVAPSWITGWGEIIGFAVLAGVAVAVFLVPRFIPVSVENSKWTFFGYWFLTLLGSIVALASAAWYFGWMKASGKSSAEMLEIGKQVRSGVRAFVWRYRRFAAIYFGALLGFVWILAYFLKAKDRWMFGPYLQSRWVLLGLLTGVFSAALAGRFGMRAAIWGSVRATAVAKESLGRAMQTTLKFGAVTGLMTVGFCLLEIALWFGVLYWVAPKIFEKSFAFPEILAVMLCFGIGAASYALFAGIGGGIFARAGEVGSEFAEEGGGVPKNHKRNPGAIANCAGKIIGMGTNLYALYYVAILATAILGATAFNQHVLPKRMGTWGTRDAGTGRERQVFTFASEAVNQMQFRGCMLVFGIAGLGALATVLGVWAVRAPEKAKPKALLREIDRGINRSVFLTILGALLLTRLLLPDFMGLALSVTAGALAGWAIGRWSERVAGSQSKLAYGVAERASVGPATMTLGGTANALRAVPFPVITVAVAALLAFGTATHWRFSGRDLENWFSMGLYGVGLAAIGMLGILGITLAGDAYGSIADNTLRHTMMAKSDPKLRKRMAVLNALGGTLAMRGKVFVITSMGLIGLALLAAYVARYAGVDPNDFRHRSLQHDELNILQPRLLIGVFVGAMATFVFSALTFRVVEGMAHSIAGAIRQQFRENPGMLQAGKTSDCRKFIALRTKTLYRLMRRQLLFALFVPLAVGFVLGPTGVVGLLFGATVCGLCVGVFLACAGQSWAVAKEHVRKIAEEADLPSDPSKEIAPGNPACEVASRSLATFLLLMGTFSVLIIGLIIRFNMPVIWEQIISWLFSKGG